MPNGLIQDDSLRTHPEGLALSLTLPWYRSLWLSSVSTLRLSIDGEPGIARHLECCVLPTTVRMVVGTAKAALSATTPPNDHSK